MVNNEIDLNKVILENYKTKYSEYTKKYSKTSLFILPMLGFNLSQTYIIKFLNNAFIDDKGLEHNYVRPIFMLFNVPKVNDPNWLHFSKTLEKKEEFIYDYTVGYDNEKGVTLIMYVFNTPLKYTKDYYNFKQGKYSKFSTDYKKLFPQYVKNNLGKEVESIAWGAINKSVGLKKRIKEEFNLDNYFVNSLEEIWDAPRKEEEYYRYNKVI